MQQFITYKNTQVAFSVYGEGEPVVLLHGFLENATMWKDIVPSIKKRNKLIVIDLLGHGSTGSITDIHTMENNAVLVKEVLCFLGIPSSIVVGHSMGGYVALALLENYPKMVSSICLLNSTAYADTEERKKTRLRAIKLAENNFKALVSMSVSNLFVREFSENKKDEIEEIKEQALLISKEAYIATTEGLRLRTDKTELVSNVCIPKLFVIGEKDPVIDSDVSINEALSLGVDFVVLPSGHMSHIESKEAIISILNKFCSKQVDVKI